MSNLSEQAIKKYNSKNYEDAITDFLLLKEQDVHNKKEICTKIR